MSHELWRERKAVPCRLPSCGHIIQTSRRNVVEVQCTVCGDGPPLQRRPSRDYVPSETLTWPWAECTKTNHLRFVGQTEASPVINNVDDLVAAMTSSPGSHLSLGTAPLQVRPPPDRTFHVWRAATYGCSVHDGVIELSERGVLLLTGRGAHFQGTTFTGGVVMCAGAKHCGSFQDCSFRGTALYAVHGAAVTVRGCGIADSQPGITASGEGTYITLSATSIHNCRTSIAVDCGAAVSALGCHLTRTALSASAVTVSGPCSHAVMEDCVVSGDRTLPGASIDGESGVAVRRGSAQLMRCRLNHFAVAVFGGGIDSSLELQEVEVTNSFEGVVLCDHARALVRETLLRCGGLADTEAFGTGFDVCTMRGGAGGACMQAERCEVRCWAVGARGIHIGGCGAVAATLCRFTCSAEVLRTAAGGGRVSLSHCRGDSPVCCLSAFGPDDELRLQGGLYMGSMNVCMMNHGAKLTAVGSEFRSGRGEANACGVISVFGPASARLLLCHVRGGVMGVLCSSGTVHAVDMTVSDVRVVMPAREDPTGGMVQGGAGFAALGGRLTVVGGSVQRCVVGVETQEGQFGEPSVSIDGVKCTDCCVGVLAGHGAEVHVAACEFRGPGLECGAAADMRKRRFTPEASVAVLFRDTAFGTVAHCSFEGHPSGVRHLSPREVKVAHCSFKVSLEREMCFMMSGKVVVEDCVAEAVAGEDTFSVVALDGSECEIRRCCFTGVGSGISASGRCSVTAVDVKVDGGGLGFSVHNEACMAVQDCSVSGAEVGMSLTGGGGSLSAKRVTLEATDIQLQATLTKEDGSRAPMALKLADCVLSGGRGGVLVQTAVEGSLRRCRIEGASWGMQLGGQSNIRVTHCSVSRCRMAVMVGEDFDDLMLRCRVCGASGVSALKQAFKVLRGGDGGRPGAELCAHRGAVVRVRMADCHLAQCRDEAVFVNPNGRVSAERVTAEWCDVGFKEIYIGERSEFAGCRAVGCDVASTAERVGTDMPAVAIPQIEVVPVAVL